MVQTTFTKGSTGKFSVTLERRNPSSLVGLGLERLERVTELVADRPEALVNHHRGPAGQDQGVGAGLRHRALDHVLGDEADEAAPNGAVRYAVHGVSDLHSAGAEVVQAVLHQDVIRCLIRVEEGDRERLLVHVGMLHELEAWRHPSSSRKASDLLIAPLLATDAEDAVAFVDDSPRGPAEVERVANLHLVHVLREPAAIRELRMLILVVGLDDQLHLAELHVRRDRRVRAGDVLKFPSRSMY